MLFQFEKPGRRENFDYPDMPKESGNSCNFYRKFCNLLDCRVTKIQ